MRDNSEIKQITERLNKLLSENDRLRKELIQLRIDINKKPEMPSPATKEVEKVVIVPNEELENKPGHTPRKKASFELPGNFSLEKFIGENLINKIGILILVIGVFIGAKYAIDHQFISPTVRVIIGYIFSGILLGLSYRIRRNMNNFSAVLLSGALSLLYIITFIAFDSVNLIPLWLAFILMVVFTVYAAISSLSYNRSIIAHMGLVGAYAIPFLLSNDEGNHIILFSYILLINVGILFITFHKDWRSLLISAFSFSWLILVIYSLLLGIADGREVSMLFISFVFYLLFYVAILAFRLRNHLNLRSSDLILITLNNTIHFLLGYALLEIYSEELHGIYSLAVGLINLSLALIIRRIRPENHGIYSLILGFAIVFATIAIPLQFDGEIITLLWGAESLLLLWLGRTKKRNAYEYLAYPALILALFSLISVWYDQLIKMYDEYLPIFNTHFLTSLFMVGILSLWILVNKRFPSIIHAITRIIDHFTLSMFLSILLILTIYNSIRIEIITILDYSDLDIYGPQIRHVAIAVYSIVFMSAITLISNFNKMVGSIKRLVIFFNGISILVFALYTLPLLNEHNDIGLTWRYAGILALVILIYQTFRLNRSLNDQDIMLVDIVLFIAILGTLSYELIHWLDRFNLQSSDKLGVSILWGAFALTAGTLGILFRKTHLRISSLILLGITLLKVFIYDLKDLDSLSKTIVFIALGIFLLVLSYLYNQRTKSEPEI